MNIANANVRAFDKDFRQDTTYAIFYGLGHEVDMENFRAIMSKVLT